MEILHKQSPVRLPNVITAWTGLLSSTVTRASSAAVERHRVLVGVGPTLLLPIISTLVPRGRLELIPHIERRKPNRVYSHPQDIRHPSRIRVYSRGENRDDCSCRRNVTTVKVGAFREGFESVGRVAQLRKYGECGRCTRPVAMPSSLNGNDAAEETNLDLQVEVEVFRFMQQSSKPDEFPTRQDLKLAGRADLVMAIEDEGGWLAAGWDDGSTFVAAVENTNGRHGEVDGYRRQRSKRKYKARKSVRIDDPVHAIKELVNGVTVVREVVNAVDDKDGRRKKSNQWTRLNVDGDPHEVLAVLERVQIPYKEKSTPRRRKSSRRPSSDDLQVLERIASLIIFTEELKLKRPDLAFHLADLSQDSPRKDFSKGTRTGTMSRSFYPENSFLNGTMGEVPAENSVRDARDTVTDVAAVPKRKRKPKKKERAKVVKDSSTDEVNGTSDWTHKIIDQREELTVETRSRSDEISLGTTAEDDSKSMQNRIHTLAARLADTRAALRSGREALWQTGTDAEGNNGAIAELIDAEDALEFRENAIMHARTELNTARAQVAALEGNLKVEIMEARKILDERNQQTERARAGMRQLRTTRIVWPNHGNEVFLTGSFDGWNTPVKLEKSSAGVFVVSLTLYPGRYEVKFVVDGSWKVDTKRPIVYVGGFENNVLNVS